MCFVPQRGALFRIAIEWSKSSLSMRCFDLEMFFAPQRRALFRHLNLQKWSGTDVFWHFFLPGVRAITVCNFSSFIWPAGSAPASLGSLLFDPPKPQNTGKHSVSRLPYLFPHLHLLSSDCLHLWSSPFWLSPHPSFFLALLLPGCAFPSVHIVGSLASRLPSSIYIYNIYVFICTHVWHS